MTCLQRLRHSLACTAQHKRSRETRKGVARKGKGKRIPWRAEHVQHKVDGGDGKRWGLTCLCNLLGNKVFSQLE